ncbi:MAG: hypothetical protein HQK76_05590 [Desulfobacterales bacterium]|nr:hypothetical protein [Desulfobacterales bacterium]
MKIKVDIAPAELLDKITILEIKKEKITDSAKLKNIQTELNIIIETKKKYIPESNELSIIYEDLKCINRLLWDIEDNIRDCEREKNFGEKFISLARSVYITNDKRAEIKRKINNLLGSEIIEEKAYSDY